MGGTNSKGGERTEALKLCKERKRFIKQGIDSRYDLAAAHIAYIESLKNIGIALRRYAEAEILIESSISTSATEIFDKTPSHSSYPSPSQSNICGLNGNGSGVFDYPVLNGNPISPSTSRMSYMVAGGTTALTVRMKPFQHNSSMHMDMDMDIDMDMDDCEFPNLRPPPEPPRGSGSSWDFFDPVVDDDNDDGGNSESFRFQNNLEMGIDDDEKKMNVDFEGDNEIDEEIFVTPKSNTRSNNGRLLVHDDGGGNSAVSRKCGKSELKGNGCSVSKVGLQQSISKTSKALVEKNASEAEREDPSEFITHRAKDFLSSVKDIEHRFFRASESGREVSRMLEANKIHVGYAEAKGKSTASVCLASFRSACCQGKNANITDGAEHVTKVITWKRTTSSRSSSSRNPLNATSKDDDDSGSDFIEEFCMIAGSHSSTLERLYAWERKLYDEVKASEIIRREYDRKCNKLRHQFAKDLSVQVIDKTRAVVKDLHSRIRVALHAVDSISRRIEKMRDDELLPQLLELIQGLIRMWKVMLECHHSQYITISLAYHSKSSAGTTAPGYAQKQIMLQLQEEVEYFGLSFADWINSHTSYVEALNGWLQNCILLPQERSKNRRAFSPRRVLAPPIFVLLRDWSTGIKSLPSEELSDSIRGFLSDLRQSIKQTEDETWKKETSSTTPDISNNNDKSDCCNKDDEKNEEDDINNNNNNNNRSSSSSSSNLSCLQTSLTKVFDRLTKFSEASLKMSEDVKQKCETARNAYINYKPPRSYSI